MIELCNLPFQSCLGIFGLAITVVIQAVNERFSAMSVVFCSYGRTAKAKCQHVLSD